jgi:hypothetical protein
LTATPYGLGVVPPDGVGSVTDPKLAAIVPELLSLPTATVPVPGHATNKGALPLPTVPIARYAGTHPEGKLTAVLAKMLPKLNERNLSVFWPASAMIAVGALVSAALAIMPLGTAPDPRAPDEEETQPVLPAGGDVVPRTVPLPAQSTNSL